VAAAYFTVYNSGALPDQLVTVQTPIAGTAMVHRYQTASSGAQVMVPVPGPLPIPTSGTLSLQPGGMHVMLEPLRRSLRAGEHVAVTLRFAHAGTLTLSVPVIPLDDNPMGPMTPPPGRPGSGGMDGMDGMSGMGGTSTPPGH
jgi:copper(I)-binding protein